MIPLTDLQAQYAPLREQIAAAVGAVLDAQDFILGARVSAFEVAVAELLGSESAIGVSSGSDALLLGLLGAGVGPGDEVITTPLTFVATAEAIVRAGARPVFVDVDGETLCLDPQAVLAAVTPRTRALLPVHLFGQPAALGALGDIARRHDLSLIEDAAQAFGARHDGRFVGTVGHYGALSFFPAKILGGAGDGGMVLCSAERAERIRALRLHGSRDKQTFEWVGGNYRLDALQAAILSVKLPYVLGWVERRRARADAYCRAFEQRQLGARLQLPSKQGSSPCLQSLRRAHRAPRQPPGAPDRATDRLLRLLRNAPAFTALLRGLGLSARPIARGRSGSPHAPGVASFSRTLGRPDSLRGGGRGWACHARLTSSAFQHVIQRLGIEGALCVRFELGKGGRTEVIAMGLRKFAESSGQKSLQKFSLRLDAALDAALLAFCAAHDLD